MKNLCEVTSSAAPSMSKSLSASHFPRLTAAAFLLLFFGAASLAQQSPVMVNGAQDASSSRHRLSPPPPTTVTPAPEDLSKATLAPGFLVGLEIYDTPEMSATLRVDAAGNIRVPLAGAVYVQGKTLTEAQAAITNALVAGQILTAPQVTLNVIEFATANATVLGEVQAPGRVQLLAARPLSDVLAAVGGETLEAGDISVEHTGPDGQTSTKVFTRTTRQGARLLKQTLIYPGDTVTVERAGVVYILGAISRPGGYIFLNEGSMNLLQLVASAQGTTLRASVSSIEILRPNGETYNHIKVPLSKMQKGDVDPTVLLPNDIVYVPTSAIKTVFLDVGSMLAAATSAAIYTIR
jgi:polysaccharide export outer membrane protein